MPDTLAVDVNPDGMHTLRVPERFRTEGAFEIRLTNHGEATHVYLSLDDELSSVASLPDTNHYVRTDDSTIVRVNASRGGRAEGELTIATQYGSNRQAVRVAIGEDDTEEQQPVEIAEDLTKPAEPEGPPPLADRVGGVRAVPVVALGVVAVVLAVGALLTAGTTQLVFAVLAVVSAGIAAAYLAFA